jgi:hypothetical protein
MEIAPELQFRHYALAEVQLPGEAVVRIENVSRDEVSLCCDPDTHVFNPEHTEAAVAEALRGTHWLDLDEWTVRRPADGI